MLFFKVFDIHKILCLFKLYHTILSLAKTDSSNSIMNVVPLCQWAVTFAGKFAPFNTASIIPAVNAAQLSFPLSFGTDMYLLTKCSVSII